MFTLLAHAMESIFSMLLLCVVASLRNKHSSVSFALLAISAFKALFASSFVLFESNDAEIEERLDLGAQSIGKIGESVVHMDDNFSAISFSFSLLMSKATVETFFEVEVGAKKRRYFSFLSEAVSCSDGGLSCIVGLGDFIAFLRARCAFRTL
tara:strand:+ start:536 stop:994 length:459 start_codon:yes stop_codon:yes gene_type:complete